MSKFNIEEVKAMSLGDQIVELEKQIQRVKDTREQNAASIRQLEEVNENCNQQLETLIELKWSCKFQKRMGEVMDVLGDNEEWMNDNPAGKNEDLITKGKRRIAKTIQPLRKGYETWSGNNNTLK